MNSVKEWWNNDETVKLCVGNTCKDVKKGLASSIGNLVGVASGIDVSDPLGTTTRLVLGTMTQVSNKRILHMDLAILNQTLKRAQTIIDHQKRRQYPPCSLSVMEHAVEVVRKRIEEYRRKDFQGEVYRGAWAEWYRGELVRDTLMLVVAISVVLVDIQVVSGQVIRWKLAAGDKEKQDMLESELATRCIRMTTKELTDRTPGQCIGSNCKYLQERLPELAAALSNIASVIDTSSAQSMAISSVAAIPKITAAKAAQATLETDLDVIRHALSEGQSLITKLERAPFRPCALGNMIKIMTVLEVRLNEYQDLTAKGRFSRAAWSEWYRTELSRDLNLFVAVMANAAVEIQDKMNLVILHDLSSSTEQQEIMSQLKATCIPSK